MLINSNFVLKAMENPPKSEKDQDRRQGKLCSNPAGRRKALAKQRWLKKGVKLRNITWKQNQIELTRMKRGEVDRE